MKNHILVCGLNGSGKSTFGRALAKKLGVAFKDIEDYYFPSRRKDDAYADPRSHEEVSEALLSDLQNSDTIVLASVKADYSKEIDSFFSKAIYIEVPKDIRLMRVRECSFDGSNPSVKHVNPSFLYPIDKNPYSNPCLKGSDSGKRFLLLPAIASFPIIQ